MTIKIIFNNIDYFFFILPLEPPLYLKTGKIENGTIYHPLIYGMKLSEKSMIFVNRWLKYPLEIFPSLNCEIK